MSIRWGPSSGAATNILRDGDTLPAGTIVVLETQAFADQANPEWFLDGTSVGQGRDYLSDHRISGLTDGPHTLRAEWASRSSEVSFTVGDSAGGGGSTPDHGGGGGSQPPPPDVEVHPGEPWDPSQSHVRVYINGREESCQFLASLSVSGGRDRRTGVPDPATMSATWVGDYGHQPEIGDRIQVAAIAPHGTPHWARNSCIPIFDGTITDVGLDWETDGSVHVDLNAADYMASLAGVMVGDTPWGVQQTSSRFEHIWDAAEAAIGQTRLPPPWEDSSEYRMDIVNAANPLLNRRDADNRPALDLIHDAMRTSRTVFTVWPHRTPLWSQRPTPWARTFNADDPTSWHPEYNVMPDLEPRNAYRASVVPCQIVTAEPIPHWTINQQGYANVIVVPYGEPPDADKPRPEVVSRHAPYAPATRDQAWKIDTDIHEQGAANSLAAAWRQRLQRVRPLLNATVVYTAQTLAAADDAYGGGQAHLSDNYTRMRYLFGLMLGGASIVAHPIDIGYRQQMRMERWYVESKKITWRPDGWQVELVASDQHTYVPSSSDDAWQANWSW